MLEIVKGESSQFVAIFIVVCIKDVQFWKTCIRIATEIYADG